MKKENKDKMNDKRKNVNENEMGSIGRKHKKEIQKRETKNDELTERKKEINNESGE